MLLLIVITNEIFSFIDMAAFRKIFTRSHIDQKILDIYIFIYKIHDQTQNRARDQTCGVMSLCAIEDKTYVVVVASYCSVCQEIPFVSRPCVGRTFGLNKKSESFMGLLRNSSRAVKEKGEGVYTG